MYHVKPLLIPKFSNVFIFSLRNCKNNHPTSSGVSCMGNLWPLDKVCDVCLLYYIINAEISKFLLDKICSDFWPIFKWYYGWDWRLSCNRHSLSLSPSTRFPDSSAGYLLTRIYTAFLPPLQLGWNVTQFCSMEVNRPETSITLKQKAIPSLSSFPFSVCGICCCPLTVPYKRWLLHIQEFCKPVVKLLVVLYQPWQEYL